MTPEEEKRNHLEPDNREEAAKEAEAGSLAEEKARAENYLANWQRAQADFINYKKRTEQEKGELSQFVKANVIYSLLPVLDNLERALDSVPAELEGNTWVEGIKLTVRNFESILETQGIKAISALGEAFDPRIHEAVRQDKGKEGIVVGEIQKGYMINNTLIRPAMVVVGTGEEV